MGCTVLNATVKENDLGLTISVDTKVSEKCGIATKGNKIFLIDNSVCSRLRKREALDDMELH